MRLEESFEMNTGVIATIFMLVFANSYVSCEDESVCAKRQHDTQECIDCCRQEKSLGIKDDYLYVFEDAPDQCSCDPSKIYKEDKLCLQNKFNCEQCCLNDNLVNIEYHRQSGLCLCEDLGDDE